MLRWKSRYLPLLASIALVVAALLNGGVGRFFNIEW